MDTIKNSYYAFKQRCSISLNKFTSLRWYLYGYFIFAVVVDIYLFVIATDTIEYIIAFVLLLSVIMGGIAIIKFFISVRKIVSGNFFFDYEKLLQAIQSNVHGSYNREYHNIFFEYETILGIKHGASEVTILKKLRSTHGNRNYYSDRLDSIARMHYTVAKLIKDEDNRRNADK